MALADDPIGRIIASRLGSGGAPGACAERRRRVRHAE
jgi:hypothetical protein